MAALPDNFSDLKPRTDREWLQHLNVKVDTIIQTQAEDREDILALFGKWDSWKDCHDRELKTNIDTLTRHSVTLKIVSWVGSIFGAGFVAFIIALITGQFDIVRP
jgi:hypothetical protein